MSAPAATIEREATIARWVWTCDEFMRISGTGFFNDQDAELIDGEIYPLQTPSPLHSCLVSHIDTQTRQIFGAGFFVRTCQPFVLNRISQPRPDICIFAGANADFRHRFPTTAEIRLVVEISDSSEARDKLVKLPAYANADIPEYWILNLRELCLEVYREPKPGRYNESRIYRPGEFVAPLHAPEGRTVSVADLLGE